MAKVIKVKGTKNRKAHTRKLKTKRGGMNVGRMHEGNEYNEDGRPVKHGKITPSEFANLKVKPYKSKSTKGRMIKKKSDLY